MSDNDAAKSDVTLASAGEHEVAEPNEAARLYDFFRGHSDRISQIIMGGHCPSCSEQGHLSIWIFGRGGGKLCQVCGWHG